ncbi:MAG: DUF2905 domain-containing protein [candidate division Zixibacteria bacterium]|nr:DUF2905 domain-containing protein [candidate division Zixibacteria bacterium]
MFAHLSKVIILFGVVLILLGGVMYLFGRLPFLGKLPGDIHIQKNNFSFYFPLASSILISLILSLLFILINIFFRK